MQVISSQKPFFLQKSQKQPPGVFFKKDDLKNFANFTVKHLCWSQFCGLCSLILLKFMLIFYWYWKLLAFSQLLLYICILLLVIIWACLHNPIILHNHFWEIMLLFSDKIIIFLIKFFKILLKRDCSTGVFLWNV